MQWTLLSILQYYFFANFTREQKKNVKTCDDKIDNSSLHSCLLLEKSQKKNIDDFGITENPHKSQTLKALLLSLESLSQDLCMIQKPAHDSREIRRGTHLVQAVPNTQAFVR